MPPDSLADLLACVRAFGGALDDTFDPTQFLTEFSARLQRVVPHDELNVVRRDEDGSTCSVFASYAVRGAVLGDGMHYTTTFTRGPRLAPAQLVLADVFEGRTLVSGDIGTDSRFRDHVHRAKHLDAGLRARLVVPLYAGRRVVGALVVMSADAGVYTDEHASICRQIAELIGPFVESVVVLHRERRRRERLKAVTALPPIFGASLKVGDVLERVGQAVRPLFDFAVMGLALFATPGQGLDLIGMVGGSRPMPPGRAMLEDFSIGRRVSRGEVVLMHDAQHELDPRLPGDRAMIDSGDRSILSVPLLFGERVGGGVFFSTPREHWYDETDVEIASGIAAALVLAVQHQRLAEQQQRLGVVEAKAEKLERQVTSLKSALGDRFGFDTIIGEAPNFVAAIDNARKVAPTNTTVMLTGESGTGKEVLARAIHYASPRADGPFVAINCAALPETLVESELFGHERGAFTGADKLKRGRFELAAGGTLFLDEIGELAPAMQAKLLRVLQERQFERVGGTTTLDADVRLIAATNRDLQRAVAEGRFREDLYYRLAVFQVRLPALRERADDVLLLADHFVHALGAKLGKIEPGLSQAARDLLLTHSWPGNIRELQNAIERALILAGSELISAEQLGIVSAPAPHVAVVHDAPVPNVAGRKRADALAEQEKRMIADALRRAGGNKTRAAAELGMSRTQLLRHARRLGLDT